MEYRILDISKWHTPATDYHEAEIGNFRIHRGMYTRGMYQNWGLDGYLFFKVKKPIPITTLQERRGKRWYGWMVDDPPQLRAMQIYAEQAYGKVLTTGLGLGLILHELAKNKKVVGVTVVEQSEDVVHLVEPYLPSLPELVILIDDFYRFLEKDTTNFDTVIVDLWVSHDKKEKLDILYHRVLPLIPILRFKYPLASITFHGFQTVSDIKPISEEMVKLQIEINK